MPICNCHFMPTKCRFIRKTTSVITAKWIPEQRKYVEVCCGVRAQNKPKSIKNSNVFCALNCLLLPFLCRNLVLALCSSLAKNKICFRFSPARILWASTCQPHFPLAGTPHNDGEPSHLFALNRMVSWLFFWTCSLWTLLQLPVWWKDWEVGAENGEEVKCSCCPASSTLTVSVSSLSPFGS